MDLSPLEGDLTELVLVRFDEEGRRDGDGLGFWGGMR